MPTFTQTPPNNRCSARTYRSHANRPNLEPNALIYAATAE